MLGRDRAGARGVPSVVRASARGARRRTGGDRLGYAVTRTTAFAFSRLRHPQYVGAVLTIWGLFALLRFPAADWYLVPALETLYYGVGARLEERAPAPTVEPARRPRRSTS